MGSNHTYYVLCFLHAFQLPPNTYAILPIFTPRAHARSGVKQWVLSVSVSVCHQNLGLITTTKGLNASKRHSNNDNSEKTVHGVPEGG